MLSDKKDENARIRIEGVLRQKNLVSLRPFPFREPIECVSVSQLVCVEILSLMSELLQQRLQLIVKSNACSPDLIEAVATIIYCSDRITDVAELKEITLQFALKYSQEWCRTHINNESNCVSPRVIKLLSLRPPDMKAVIKALQEVAAEHNVAWEPDEAAFNESQNLGAIVPLNSLEIPPDSGMTPATQHDEAALGEQFAKAHHALPGAGGDYPGVFRIYVHKAANLVHGQGQAAQHPYVRLSAQGSLPQTTAVDHNGGVDPSWAQQQFSFNVAGPGSVVAV